MSFSVPMRQTTWDAVLRWALLGGGLFDLAFGIAVLVAWQRVLPLMGIAPAPDIEVFVKLAAYLSLGIGATFAIGAIAPWRYHANINIATAMRFGGAAFFAYFVLCRPLLPPRLLLMAGAEFILGVLHFIYSRRTAAAAAGPQ
jgi:hypothetical protein